MNFGNVILRCASLALFGMGACAMGCVAAPEEMDAVYDEEIGADYDEEMAPVDNEEIEEREVVAFTGGGDDDPSTRNHLRKICFDDYRFHRSARLMADTALADASGNMPWMPYMPSPTETGDYANCRRDVLEVMVGCALGKGTTIRDTTDTFTFMGTTIYKSYTGDVGIAPDWRTRALTTTEREYVTGCMLERINLYGAEVEVLLWGAGNAALTARVPYTFTTYTYQESAAWGNLFDSTVYLPWNAGTGAGGTPAFTSYICQHSGGVCLNGNALLRLCDSDDSFCGMTYTGSCNTVASLCSSYPTLPQCAGFSRRVNASLDVGAGCYY